MAQLTVTPDSFVFVHYDHTEVVSIARRVADRVGYPADRELVVAIEESTPLQRITVRSLEPVTIDVEGGAFEDPKRPRWLSIEITEASLAKVLCRVIDRIDGSFGDAPVDASLTLAEASAWNVYAVGRSARAGFVAQQQRHRYGFRNRHSFSDAADEVFDHLWSADRLTWAELQEQSARALGGVSEGRGR
jgi:hypothetical protein